ncbi:MAG: alginate lyase family protein [Hyphomicrobiales bacterium]|nr:MAG: alginate lyase family protein [Hyphomicrobiales bacterium]
MTTPRSPALQLFHTVRHLRPVQVYGRAWRQIERGRIDARPAPRIRAMVGAWVAPAPRERSLHPAWRVCFLNHDGDVGGPAQWEDPTQTRLWLYNLHYFDDLASKGDEQHRALQRQLIGRWIAENPPAGGTGWEPYPVSLRAANWIKFWLGGNPPEAGWHDSLAVQLRWLMGHLEWHLLGNHLLANAKALVLGGLYFEGDEAEDWLHKGFEIYARQLPEQILGDGGHFELSPMYHAIILEDLLDLANIARAYGRTEALFAALPEIIGRMRAWLAAMTHRDGEIALFNDAAFGIAAPLSELEAYAQRLGLSEPPRSSGRLRHLAASGYVRLDRGDAAAILDLAAVGPDYLPGHAHADTLSFELSVGAERVIVNGGTSTYERGPLRAAQRATRAHSTVEVAGADSSEVWASFRVARRAYVEARAVSDTAAATSVSGTHNGYRRLPGKPLHRRSWVMTDNALEVRDLVAGKHPMPAIARFHLAPGVTATSDRLLTASGRAIRWRSTAPATVEQSDWHPRFGQKLPASTLLVPMPSGELITVFEWD